MSVVVPYSQIIPYRPFIALRIVGSQRTRNIDPVLVDTGSIVSVFDWDLASYLGVILRTRDANGNPLQLRWRGTMFKIGYGIIQFAITGKNGAALTWDAEVAFSEAPIPYALFGQSQCLDYFDTTFVPRGRYVTFVPNSSYPGSA